MSNEALKYQILGFLSEQPEDIQALAKNTKANLLEHVKEMLVEPDDDRRAAILIGITLATIEFEDIEK